MRSAAVDQERVRLARDLHDGLLQSLAAASLQVQAARDALGIEPKAAERRLGEVQRMLADEQRSLRIFLWQMRPGSSSPGGGSTAPLGERVRRLAERVGREWGLAVRIEDEGLRVPLGPGLEQQLYLMVHEAVTNAARHSGARTVQVEMAANDGRLRVLVEDDGRGFPFEGRRDGEELAAAGQGPVSLRERAALLGGHLVVDSSGKGSRVEIVVPHRPEGA
jgi:signal transduction histidine kinase